MGYFFANSWIAIIVAYHIPEQAKPCLVYHLMPRWELEFLDNMTSVNRQII
jgi:hypothetical protein